MAKNNKKLSDDAGKTQVSEQQWRLKRATELIWTVHHFRIMNKVTYHNDNSIKLSIFNTSLLLPTITSLLEYDAIRHANFRQTPDQFRRIMTLNLIRFSFRNEVWLFWDPLMNLLIFRRQDEACIIGSMETAADWLRAQRTRTVLANEQQTNAGHRSVYLLVFRSLLFDYVGLYGHNECASQFAMCPRKGKSDDECEVPV